MRVTFYLGILNDQMQFTLPSKANTIYKGQADPTPLFKKMGLKMLGDMYCLDMAISKNFKNALGSEYQSEEEPSEVEEEETGG